MEARRDIFSRRQMKIEENNTDSSHGNRRDSPTRGIISEDLDTADYKEFGQRRVFLALVYVIVDNAIGIPFSDP